MIEKRITQSLSDYLEFDSNEIFVDKSNLIRVFGGAIRDIISNDPINDIDILCGSKSLKFVESILEKSGYYFSDILNGKDIQSMYQDIHVINEPHTWIKGKKIVQLIRPSIGTTQNYEAGFNDLISNVDLSCCGVSFDGFKLYEDYPNSILHCKMGVFSVNTKAKMYSQNRVHHRIRKMVKRGWIEIENTLEANRDLKIKSVVSSF